MAGNIFQQRITPVKPKIIETQQIFVYVEEATNDKAGIASFDKDHFIVNNGKVELATLKLSSTPFDKPSLIQLDKNDFKVTNKITSVNWPYAYKGNDNANTNGWGLVKIGENSIGWLKYDTNNLLAVDTDKVDAEIDGKIAPITADVNNMKNTIDTVVALVDANNKSVIKLNSDFIKLDTKVSTYDDAIASKLNKNEHYAVPGLTVNTTIKNGDVNGEILLESEYNNLEGKFGKSRLVVNEDGIYIGHVDTDTPITLEKIATQPYVQNELSKLTFIHILNTSSQLVITATSDTVQSVATKYVQDNYDRDPQQWDGLVITMTDSNNDKILYTYTAASGMWLNVGINNVDLTDYVSKDGISDININYGEESVLYDTTDGITVTSNGQIKYKDNTVHQITTEYNLPIIAGDNTTINADAVNKKIVISSEIPKSSATVLGGVFLYKIGTVWNIDTAGNDPAVRIPEGTTIVENAMLKDDMEALYIPSSVIQSNVSIDKDKTYTSYRELHCDMDLEQFLNIRVNGYRGSLGGYNGSGVDLYLKEVKQDIITVSTKYGITTLGYQLCGIGMTELILEEGIERIQGIEYCSNLTTLRLPVSLKTIDNYALSNNNNLKDVYYAGTKSQWYQITLGSNYNKGSLFEVVHCSDGDLDLVVKGPIVRVPDGITTLTLANLATDMETLIIPDSITSCNARINKQTYKVYNRLETTKSLEDFLAIEAANNDYRNAISGYGNTPKFGGQLTDLVINDKVQTTITVPGTVTDAGYNLSSLSITELTLEEGVTILGCAGYCHNLTTVNLPSTLTTIGNRGFYGCTNLTTLNYAGTMAQWANVSLNSYWHRQTPLTVVHCSDGDVTL